MAGPDRSGADRAVYVYGVVAAQTPAPECTGIAAASVRSLVVDDLGALVSDLPDPDAFDAGSDELLVHSNVLGAALELGAVLPMRFGVVLADDEAVQEELLRRFHDDLVAQLAEVEGRVELHLRAIYEGDSLMSEVVRTRPEIARRRDALRGRPADATYYERIELGQMVAEAAEGIRERDTGAMLQELAPLAVATHVDPVEHEDVAASLCFLVDGDHIEAFDAAVDDLGRREQQRLRFRYTGPLPAYSFVELPG